MYITGNSAQCFVAAWIGGESGGDWILGENGCMCLYGWVPLLSTWNFIVRAMVFPVVMYGCESWTIKKAEHWRIDAFQLWCWRRLLRVPWTARISSQFILKEISPDYSLEGLMLKLKLQYFGHLMQTADSLEKTLMLGKIEGRRRRGQQRMRWLDDINGHEFEQTAEDTESQGSLACFSPWACKESDTT